ncbi:methylthioribulose-1-phosphate dehydratase [Acrasis kona]|uniref:Probable methylthioribulose-1-phosphate dehydratase n=1 Tax=Acrasis kona TaxID=1008807 RepID=A0AAW2YUC3_9EUKA
MSHDLPVSTITDHTQLKQESPSQNVIVQLLKLYYKDGWVSGTGGGISIRKNGFVYMAPSGVHKECIDPEEIFVLDEEGKIVYDPSKRESKLPVRPVKLSACSPLFTLCYKHRNAGAVMHSHHMSTLLATLIFPEKEFKITHVEMIKGIRGHGYHSTLVVPIIDNVAEECDLKDSMEEAVLAYPNTYAVLVRRHGVYIWGKDWLECKTHSEVYHYLFDAAVKMKQLGFDPSTY